MLPPHPPLYPPSLHNVCGWNFNGMKVCQLPNRSAWVNKEKAVHFPDQTFKALSSGSPCSRFYRPTLKTVIGKTRHSARFPICWILITVGISPCNKTPPIKHMKRTWDWLLNFGLRFKKPFEAVSFSRLNNNSREHRNLKDQVGSLKWMANYSLNTSSWHRLRSDLSFHTVTFKRWKKKVSSNAKQNTRTGTDYGSNSWELFDEVFCVFRDLIWSYTMVCK